MGNIKNFFKGFKAGQHLFGELIGTIVNSIVLFLAYVIGVGLTFVFSKIKKKKFLDKELDKTAKTYWEDLNLKKKKMEDYYRQH